MPIKVSKTTGTGVYGVPFVGPSSGPVHVQVDVSALTSREVDADGYLKPGVVLTLAGLLPTAAGDKVGVVPEAIKIHTDNTSLAGVTADPFVVVHTYGTLSRDITEDNLGAALSAAEIAALNGAGSQIVLLLT